jgi:hypothetical protein
MHVDRSRFLVLTASLAAAACNQPQPIASPETGGAEPPKSRGSDNSDDAAVGSASVWLEIEPGSEDTPRSTDTGDCDNQAGVAKSCAIKAPAGHCESFDWTLQLCQSLPNFMQPRAAEAAMDCMLAASGTPRICDWDVWQTCTAAGIQASCVEPSTRTDCETISSRCAGRLDLFTCQQAFSAVQPRVRSSLASCVQEFCELDFCVMDLGHF